MLHEKRQLTRIFSYMIFFNTSKYLLTRVSSGGTVENSFACTRFKCKIFITLPSNSIKRIFTGLITELNGGEINQQKILNFVPMLSLIFKKENGRMAMLCRISNLFKSGKRSLINCGTICKDIGQYNLTNQNLYFLLIISVLTLKSATSRVSKI